MQSADASSDFTPDPEACPAASTLPRGIIAAFGRRAGWAAANSARSTAALQSGSKTATTRTRAKASSLNLNSALTAMRRHCGPRPAVAARAAGGAPVGQQLYPRLARGQGVGPATVCRYLRRRKEERGRQELKKRREGAKNRKRGERKPRIEKEERGSEASA
jgi:hypothetical protein